MKLNKTKIQKETDYEIHDNFLFFSLSILSKLFTTHNGVSVREKWPGHSTTWFLVECMKRTAHCTAHIQLIETREEKKQGNSTTIYLTLNC